MTSSQITDFTTAVNKLIPSSSNYLITNPTTQTSFNSNYLVGNSNFNNNTISATKL